MEDSLKVHRTMLRFVWESGIRFHDLRCLATFVWMVTGLVMSHVVHLGRWATYRKAEVKAASKERQFSRWLHNAKIDPLKVYRPMPRSAFSSRSLSRGTAHRSAPLREQMEQLHSTTWQFGSSSGGVCVNVYLNR